VVASASRRVPIECDRVNRRLDHNQDVFSKGAAVRTLEP
jgi:hypothetical protein